jgi:hypothetical protein
MHLGLPDTQAPPHPLPIVCTCMGMYTRCARSVHQIPSTYILNSACKHESVLHVQHWDFGVRLTSRTSGFGTPQIPTISPLKLSATSLAT